jgi:hypothetical protein
MNMGITLKTTTGKVLASAALVATAAGVAGMGTYGGWVTTTTPASQAVSVATVAIALGASGTPNDLAVGIDGVLPGDRIERLVTLSNAGTADLNAITMTTTAGSPASLLTSDSTNGLQLTVESCSVPWSATKPYTCSAQATKTTVLASAPIIGANRTLSGLSSLTAKGVDNLKFSAVLPDSAPGTFQGVSSTVTFSFAATQRTATVK